MEPTAELFAALLPERLQDDERAGAAMLLLGELVNVLLGFDQKRLINGLRRETD